LLLTLKGEAAAATMKKAYSLWLLLMMLLESGY
jgi:hypothetical protein